MIYSTKFYAVKNLQVAMEITKQRNNLLYSSQYRTARNFQAKFCGFLKIALVSKFGFHGILIVEIASESYLNLILWSSRITEKHKIFSTKIFLLYSMRFVHFMIQN